MQAMANTMQHRGPILAAMLDTIANCILAGVALLSMIVAAIAWVVKDRRKIDETLDGLQDDVDELREELRRDGVHPCRGVTRAREITETIGEKVKDAKTITSRTAPDEGGYGE